ncbi:MAG: endonuclease/exonuclease/phosphatase family protein [Pseudonocardiales bacterium]|nr:endonuclease/exonuclease/phosphatase family protein [Pseudonocardiales bacterium]
MLIASLNAWGGAMYPDLARWLTGSAFDVVCLQEVTSTPDLTGGWTTFADDERTLPQRANLVADMRALLPHHQPLFVASDSGPVTGEDGTRHRQAFGLGTFVADHIMVVGARASNVHGTFTEHNEWPRDNRPRIALALRLVEPGTACGVIVVHVHGLRDRHGKVDTPDRRAQAERIAGLVESVREPDDLVVVCGDLNLLPDSATFDVLGSIGLVELVGTADTRTSRYPKPVRHASYVLVSDPKAVRRFDIVAEPEVSDHRALVLELWRATTSPDSATLCAITSV